MSFKVCVYFIYVVDFISIKFSYVFISLLIFLKSIPMLPVWFVILVIYIFFSFPWTVLSIYWSFQRTSFCLSLHCLSIFYLFPSLSLFFLPLTLYLICCFQFFKKIFIYLGELGLCCSMWDLVPRPGIKPGSPALGMQSLSHRTTREVPVFNFFKVVVYIVSFSFLLF